MPDQSALGLVEAPLSDCSATGSNPVSPTRGTPGQAHCGAWSGGVRAIYVQLLCEGRGSMHSSLSAETSPMNAPEAEALLPHAVNRDDAYFAEVAAPSWQ
jgi:hypothetical protein